MGSGEQVNDEENKEVIGWNRSYLRGCVQCVLDTVHSHFNNGVVLVLARARLHKKKVVGGRYGAENPQSHRTRLEFIDCFATNNVDRIPPDSCVQPIAHEHRR
jgi:hypothetical protein